MPTKLHREAEFRHPCFSMDEENSETVECRHECPLSSLLDSTTAVAACGQDPPKGKASTSSLVQEEEDAETTAAQMREAQQHGFVRSTTFVQGAGKSHNGSMTSSH